VANGYRQNDPEATEQLYRENAPTFLLIVSEQSAAAAK